ncbi:MAG: EAL domain-containing protein [Acaryochloridaceae cyanobacterium RL_2_7]|nr:EAL domain-containing protein [Acaryochloridaceae cyanobacterium RL_2_7]
MQPAAQATKNVSFQGKGFELWYQPAYDAHSGQVQHNEVLLRWRDSKGRLLLPKDFMPWVSQAKMKLHLDKLVLKKAVQKLKRLPQAQLSINLSEESLGSPEFAQFVFDEVTRAQIPAQSLKFEISELQASRHFKSGDRIY